jgi:molecular chaperone GrpE
LEDIQDDQAPASEDNMSAGQDNGDDTIDLPKDAASEGFDQLKKERDEYYDLLLRKQAEFENYRRRVNREKSEIRAAVKIELLRELLPILDACEKGLASMQTEDADPVSTSFLDGYELLLRELNALLDRNEVTAVPGVGETFDPNFHEAVIREFTKESEEGEILEEFRKGYQVGDRLLRPSQVKVAVWPEEETSD